MRNPVRNYYAKIPLLILLVSLLVLVRLFEDELFYDPFAGYFLGDYLTRPFPSYDTLLLYLNLIFRYTLNTAISLAIIYVLFSDWQLVRFSAILYLFFLVVLILAFFVILKFFSADYNFALFYIRRFLIQPILLLLFVPAFYYQKHIQKN